MPGYTHLQKAQPITLAFHLMAYAQMFMRDVTRFEHAYDEADAMPLGSGALAGTTYPLNRDRVRELLGFSRLTDNALGRAGSAVLIPTAKRAIIWRTKHDRRTFTPRVDFITAQGNVSEIVTPLCVFTMYQGQLILKSVHPYTTIDEVAENTAFPIRYFSIETTPPPTAEELRALEEIDPLDLRNIQFR